MNLILSTFRTVSGIDTIIVYDDPTADLMDIMSKYPYTADDILTWIDIKV